jgi:AAA domain-containing protein
MGTNGAVGPGFTAHPQRLNVLLTRAKCGLVIVGDLSSTANVRHNGRIEMDAVYVQAGALLAVHNELRAGGRVATVFIRGC